MNARFLKQYGSRVKRWLVIGLSAMPCLFAYGQGPCAGKNSLSAYGQDPCAGENSLSACGQELPSGLPVVSLTTRDGTPVSGREWREGTQVRVWSAAGSEVYATRRAQVKARGNSSFDKPKKSFTLKFSKPVSLLGMPPGRKWLLIANFMDHSLLRNSLALTVARQTALAWTPAWRLVNVVENGRYAGCYLACEKVEADANRVGIGPTDGFLVELDAYPGDKHRFVTPCRGLPVNIRFPRKLSRRRFDAIRRVFDAAETILYNNDDKSLQELYDKYINLDTFADYYIVYELCQNAEPNGPRSCYMHTGRDGRLSAGPVWDFDLAFENMGLDAAGDIRPERFHLKDVRHLTVDSLYISQALWYGRLLRDSVFRTRLSERWTSLRPRFVALSDSLDRWKQSIEPSARTDQAMWGGRDPARFDDTGSFESSFNNLRRTYLRRIDVLDRLFKKP